MRPSSPGDENPRFRLDQPLDIEAGRIRGLPPAEKALSTCGVLRFAFQSLGVVYGDLGTSPLYVFPSIFPDGLAEKEDVVGALSLILYVLILIPLVKYTFIVMRANDNGEGGSFALYSLVCRHVKVNTIPNQHPTDQKLTTYSRRDDLDEKSLAGKAKRWLEDSVFCQKLLVLLVLFGTSMLIGDGILTPAISVLSSVGGIQVNQPHVSKDWIVAIACIILVGLFSVQRFGTDKVAWTFAPLVFVWLLSIGVIGVYNLAKNDHTVLKAFNPLYIIWYFNRHKTRSWVSLGGVLLSITGTEALYADVGHFSASSVQLAFRGFVFPCLVAAYLGQAAYLYGHPTEVSQAFYKSIPGRVYWPVLVVGSIAAIIASQATISATFSIVKQSVALGCFPRVKVVHTSKEHSGQVYIPEINWILMVLCILITAGFRGTVKIGNAYGIAVVALMLVTTLLMALVMLLVWRTRLVWIVLFASIYLVVELSLLSSMLFKFKQGGWAPLAIGAIFLLVMYSWHYGTLKKHEIDVQNKVPIDWILRLVHEYDSVRVPGIGLIYSELAHGVPSIFSHFMTHLPAMHKVIVFVCIKYLPVNTVPEGERFLFKDIGGRGLCLYRCVARYGYKDLHKRDDKFEDKLLDNLAKYISYHVSSSGSSGGFEEGTVSEISQASLMGRIQSVQLTQGSLGSDTIVSVESERTVGMPAQLSSSPLPRLNHRVRFAIDQVEVEVSEEEEGEEGEEDLAFLEQARFHGVVHILGDVIVRARPNSSWVKRFIVDYIYTILRRFCRENSAILNIPHETLFNVGQVYYI